MKPRIGTAPVAPKGQPGPRLRYPFLKTMKKGQYVQVAAEEFAKTFAAAYRYGKRNGKEFVGRKKELRIYRTQ